MKYPLFQQLRRHRLFLLFILLFAYAQSIHTRIGIREAINRYVFTPEAAVATFISAGILFLILNHFTRRWQPSVRFHARIVLKIFIVSLLVYLLVMTVLGYLVALLFDTVERNFNPQTLTLVTINTLLNGCIYGSFFLAYRYYQSNIHHHEQLAAYHNALAESNISRLKNQLNPHFLFNNLNVLDQLIEEDKEKASDFLNEFADLYRYVLAASDAKLVPLEEELRFVKKYFNLIQHKYGDAYLLEIPQLCSTTWIVPMTLQLLLENAIQHNTGTTAHPIQIQICCNDVDLTVSNNTIARLQPRQGAGKALHNLQEQYTLLTGQLPEIRQSENVFTVILPLIKIPTS